MFWAIWRHAWRRHRLSPPLPPPPSLPLPPPPPSLPPPPPPPSPPPHSPPHSIPPRRWTVGCQGFIAADVGHRLFGVLCSDDGGGGGGGWGGGGGGWGGGGGIRGGQDAAVVGSGGAAVAAPAGVQAGNPCKCHPRRRSWPNRGPGDWSTTVCVAIGGWLFDRCSVVLFWYT
ncbi:hypothetical protein I4F81_009359 [Pyropia yezoensis]|uniref:Uncharacterized protein n=1 Tax=Pyropia yezoensis TaxID=2788 RepID=A0ACC3CAM0_PYRYE|nr:hypothetical protein I4F81_009359 [Neopyropia yezoensis]